MTLVPGLASRATVLTIRACVDGVCQTQTYSDARSPLFVPVSPVNRGEVTVKVSITGDARQVFTGQTTTQTDKFQPNGPGCEPTVWVANVTARTSGELTS